MAAGPKGNWIIMIININIIVFTLLIRVVIKIVIIIIRHRALVAQLECSKALKGPLDPPCTLVFLYSGTDCGLYCSIRYPERILRGQDLSRAA